MIQSAPNKRRALKLQRVVRYTEPKGDALVIDHADALRFILASEASSDFNPHVRQELPAIISHWLQNSMATPVLLDESYIQKWFNCLQNYIELEHHNPASGPIKSRKRTKPIHIDYSSLPFQPVIDPKFTFIDLFAGIGGFRIALEELGGKCVFSSEWDRHAKETYFQNYGEVPFDDITKFTRTDSENHLRSLNISTHDILCAGFPCQPFSQAGRQLGFQDARGTLFFDILTIAKEKRPRVLFLENVKRLKGHDNGKTFTIICNSLREIGYKVYAKVVSAHDYGVPQKRERIFIVAFSSAVEFEFPKPSKRQQYENIGEFLEKNPDSSYTISDRMWIGHQRRLQKHRNKGNGFGYSLFNPNDKYVNTISARYWKDGSEILINQKNKNPRILTPREAARIQGYPEAFQLHPSKRHAYQQFGNSVAIPVIKAIGESILESLEKSSPAKGLLSMEPVIL